MTFDKWWGDYTKRDDNYALSDYERDVARDAFNAALSTRRPFNDTLAQEVIDGQVKEIDRLTKLIQEERQSHPAASQRSSEEK